MSTSQSLFPQLENIIKNLQPANIPAERKEILRPLIDFISLKVENKQEVRLNFICTHNSRRSHFSQVWAQSLAFYFGIKSVVCYSGGTESTALFPTVAEILRNSGFIVYKISEAKNPVYAVKYAENEHPVIGFSKKFDDPFNPQSGFAAVMTCSGAESECPFIRGAQERIPMSFEDPKAFDHTSRQAEKYQETNLQIATELYYVFSKIGSGEN
ncbi:protein-tyrosine-phosphatase [Christiangramia fulva]|uniref:Protein-tyrosine-phosphatase n=1 Tax=Christiangramia fulva TaxID=2126553 RepID=A0A2R3Z9T7_9FLAO|nr:protein-tyrosine-phosphatase [Christiangramia fulva]AVR47027.1 protein-tyrosine-phosphatase [Christiangramia fulva]